MHHRSPGSCLPVLVLFVASLAAQNHVPNGEFEQGAAHWTRSFFPLTSGGTGFSRARVAGNGPSMAIYSAMLAATSPAMTVYGSWYDAAPFALPAGLHDVSFRAMWENPGQLPLPLANNVDLQVFDAANLSVFSGYANSPNPTGLVSHVEVHGQFNAVGGIYRARLRFTNGMPAPGYAAHTIWIDDVVIGAPVTFVFGQGCPGSGAVTPVIDTVNWPQRNTNDFAVELHDALAPGLAVFVMDPVSSVSVGGPGPVPIGAGCSVLVGTTYLRLVAVAGNGPGQGMASQVLPIPANPALAGMQLFTQWGIADPGVPNALQLAVTSGAAFTIQ